MTEIFIIAVTVIVIAYDLYVYGVGDRTISRVIKDFAIKHPVVILLWGVLMGHWFWGMC